jgi:hypothetical protein
MPLKPLIFIPLLFALGGQSPQVQPDVTHFPEKYNYAV